MLKRTVFFDTPHYLKLKDRQLVFDPLGPTKEAGTCPVEDLGFVVIDHPQTLITQPLLAALAENNTAVIFCDHRHMPRGMVLNLEGHTLQNEIFRRQAVCSLPLKKRLWKQTVEEKIRNQAALLEKRGQEDLRLRALAAQVKSGDTDNREAVGARYYWKKLFPLEGFTRNPQGGYPNALLNYGYTLLRAAVARALTGSGLLATLGIHHHNRYNAFALADDVMEPFRPYVDEAVREMVDQWPEGREMDRKVKRRLLEVLTTDTRFSDCKRPLLVGLSITSASLARCFLGEDQRICYPRLE